MEKYIIHDITEETSCIYCGQPLDTNDTAYQLENDDIVCSRQCAIELSIYNGGGPNCPICDNEDNTLLGILGNLAHFRCGACGWDFSRTLKE